MKTERSQRQFVIISHSSFSGLHRLLTSSSFASKINLVDGKTVCGRVNGPSPLPSSLHLFSGSATRRDLQHLFVYLLDLKISCVFVVVVLNTSNLFKKLWHEQRSVYRFVHFFSSPALPKSNVAFLKFLLSPQSLQF